MHYIFFLFPIFSPLGLMVCTRAGSMKFAESHRHTAIKQIYWTFGFANINRILANKTMNDGRAGFELQTIKHQNARKFTFLAYPARKKKLKKILQYFFKHFFFRLFWSFQVLLTNVKLPKT